MITSKLKLIDEQTSPLFRIMWVYNFDNPARRQFDNNICAFHIGNGLILSVAHNLRVEAGIFHTIDDEIYQREILPCFSQAQSAAFDHLYPLDTATNRRYANIPNPQDKMNIINTLKQINFDTRWISFNQKKICKPYLIVQFKKDHFFNDAGLDDLFDARTYFNEASLYRNTYLIELELTDAFYSEDVALYRIVNTEPKIISKLPFIEPDFSILDDDESNLYCLQSDPTASLGRLLNNAHIEGILDHWGVFNDRIGGNYIFDGYRYLIKGYFRFGSSGAPYVVYDDNEKQFKVNAVQSEASPLQLSINNNREGNFQYVNAIASPLSIVKSKLEGYLG